MLSDVAFYLFFPVSCPVCSSPEGSDWEVTTWSRGRDNPAVDNKTGLIRISTHSTGHTASAETAVLTVTAILNLECSALSCIIMPALIVLYSRYSPESFVLNGLSGTLHVAMALMQIALTRRNYRSSG